MKSRILSVLLFTAVLLIGVSAFAQSSGCIVTPGNPCPPPVVGGKGVVANPVNLGAVIDLSNKADYVKPDAVVTPTVKMASEGSPMPICQPCRPCTDGLKGSGSPVDREKLKSAIAAVFGLG